MTDSFDMNLAGGRITRAGESTDHLFLAYADPPDNREVRRRIAVAMIQRYFNNPSLSRSKLVKVPPQRIDCFTADANGIKREWKSKPISSNLFERHLESGKFDHREFDLYLPNCPWLDHELRITPGFQAFDQTGATLKFGTEVPYGSGFPLSPVVDREGSLYSSFQLTIQKRIVALHRRVIANSSLTLVDEMIQDFRSLVSECVSLVDTSLHQLYFKAKHDRKPGWSFNAKALGERQGARMQDKLCWIFKITHRHLDGLEDLQAFHTLRELRNHLHHLDPPCFCFTMEELRDWLNYVPQVASLMWKFRNAIGSPLSEPLIEMLLLPKVRFVPIHPDRVRQPMSKDVGYETSRWRPEHADPPDPPEPEEHFG